jgi:hypothetical protein
MNTYVNNRDSEQNTADIQQTRGLGTSFKSAYYAVRIPTFPTVLGTD